MRVPQEVLKLTSDQESKQKQLLAANKAAAASLLLSLSLQLGSTVEKVTSERK